MVCQIVVLWPKSDSHHLIVSSAEMADFEKSLFQKGMPVEALMEKVGLKITDWFLQRPELLKFGLQFLVGPGHNGGDGLVVARELFLKGFDVSIWCPFQIKKDLTLQQLKYCRWLGLKELEKSPDVSSDAFWIDAIFGLGQSRPLSEELITLFRSRQEKHPGKMIALDVPSGICSDTGKALCDFPAIASHTLTVGLIKKGLIQDSALRYVGELKRIDIGIPEVIFNKTSNLIHLRVTSKDLDSLPWPVPAVNSSKYERGRVLAIAGSDEYKGAALLSLKGALASGVGSLTALVPKTLSNSLWQVCPEVVINGVFESSINQGIEIQKILAEQNFNHFDSLMIGPGLGKAKGNWDIYSELLQRFQGLLVLDADALNGLALSKNGWKWIVNRKGSTWITPHIREFERLFPELKHLPPLDAVAIAAKSSGASVLLKGAHSLIASPEGTTWQLGQVSSSVSRSGLGDVLAGFLAGVGAIGSSTKPQKVNSQLLAMAAFLHAEAGRTLLNGSNANLIVASLAKLVRSVQDCKCVQRDI